MHDVGKPATKAVGPDGRVSFHHHEVVGARLTKQRMKALRYPKDVISDVVELVALHLRFYGYGRGEWTDSAVRRYVTDAGDLLPRLHKLTRSDCTTRNRRKAAQLAADYDALEERIARIAGRGGPGPGPARPRRQRDHGAARRAAGPDRRPGLAAPQGAAPGPRARSTATRPRRSSGAGPRPGPSATHPVTDVIRASHA